MPVGRHYRRRMAQNLDDHVSAALAPGKPIVAKLINDILIKFCYLLRASHRSPIAVTHTKLSGGGSPRTSAFSHAGCARLSGKPDKSWSAALETALGGHSEQRSAPQCGIPLTGYSCIAQHFRSLGDRSADRMRWNSL